MPWKLRLCDNVIVGNPKLADNKAGYDCFKSVAVTPRGTYYAAYLTPVSRLVLHRMIEMIICSVALIALFFGCIDISVAYHQSRCRSLDEIKTASSIHDP